MTITYRPATESLMDDWFEEEKATTDIAASVERYNTLFFEHLQRAYPDAEIVVDHTLWQYATATKNEDEVLRVIEDIAVDLANDGNLWAVDNA